MNPELRRVDAVADGAILVHGEHEPPVGPASVDDPHRVRGLPATIDLLLADDPQRHGAERALSRRIRGGEQPREARDRKTERVDRAIAGRVRHVGGRFGLGRRLVCGVHQGLIGAQRQMLARTAGEMHGPASATGAMPGPRAGRAGAQTL